MGLEQNSEPNSAAVLGNMAQALILNFFRLDLKVLVKDLQCLECWNFQLQDFVLGCLQGDHNILQLPPF